MIAVAVERRSQANAGGAFLAVVTDGSAEELGATVRGAVEGGARLLTDGHKTYPTWVRSGVRHRHLPHYLLELSYRLNRRGIANRLFFYLARRAMEGRPLPYHRLTAERIG